MHITLFPKPSIIVKLVRYRSCVNCRFFFSHFNYLPEVSAVIYPLRVVKISKLATVIAVRQVNKLEQKANSILMLVLVIITWQSYTPNVSAQQACFRGESTDYHISFNGTCINILFVLITLFAVHVHKWTFQQSERHQ